ncbi:PAS domain S-box-containing protein [Beijerinckia sp. 28-YEA-48]|nr:PAS domain S-box-containing protein [Beijerinckia sp. 28-YEA-48]
MGTGDFLAAEEMEELIRHFDWAGTGLGPMDQWPACLRSALQLMLPAQAQIVMFWGPEFIAFYNDAYAPTIGDKHPRALGRPAQENWTELWSDLAPLLQGVLDTGKTVSAKDRPFYIERHGYPEIAYFDISYSPVRDEIGVVYGVFCIVSETTERRRAEEVERKLAAIVATSQDAILSTDVSLRIRSWNAGAESLYGYTSEEVIGQSVTLLIPEDRRNEEQEILTRIRAGERVAPFETKRLHKTGRLIDVSLSVSPIIEETGKVVGASKIARDICDRKEAERLQRILAEEMQHRVKNIFATVLAIARQTFNQASDPFVAMEVFEGRLFAMTRTHDLLHRGSWDGAMLLAIVEQAISPYEKERFQIAGPEARVPSRVALALSMALHELATNAVKYGSLSVQKGVVSITWQFCHAAPRVVELRWKESGGPCVSPPTRKGFGSKLVEKVLATELSGDVLIEFEPDGVLCVLRAPLDVSWNDPRHAPEIGADVQQA